ncbi:DUF1758 domain-containing protein, partial [Nephila pilipes]
KVKLKNVIALQRNIEKLRNNYYSIPNVKDAELASIDEELDLLEERLEKLERVWGYEMIQFFMKGIKLWKFLKKLLNSKMAVISYNFPLENLNYNELSNNYSQAKQRFQNLWRRFGHDSELYQQYREIILDYTEQGIIEKVETETTDNELKRPVYYLPHQAARKEDSSTTVGISLRWLGP